MNVKDAIAECIGAGFDFLVIDEDWDDEVAKMLEDAGYSVEYSEAWESHMCSPPLWLTMEPTKPC